MNVKSASFGPSAWSVLHSLALYCDQQVRLHPVIEQTAITLFEIVPDILPCVVCRQSSRDYIRKMSVITNLRDGYSRFVYNLHHKVNKKLHKKVRVSYHAALAATVEFDTPAFWRNLFTFLGFCACAHAVHAPMRIFLGGLTDLLMLTRPTSLTAMTFKALEQEWAKQAASPDRSDVESSVYNAWNFQATFFKRLNWPMEYTEKGFSEYCLGSIVNRSQNSQ